MPFVRRARPCARLPKRLAMLRLQLGSGRASRLTATPPAKVAEPSSRQAFLGSGFRVNVSQLAGCPQAGQPARLYRDCAVFDPGAISAHVESPRSGLHPSVMDRHPASRTGAS